MFNIELAIKFGSNEVIVFRKGFGIVAKEPAYLAVLENGSKIKVKAIGKEAERLFHSANDITVYHPIENSEIKNEKMAAILLGEILSNVVQDRMMLTNVSALVSVPCALNDKQLLKIKKVLRESGVSRVTFVQNSVCARRNLDLDPHEHIMVVDVGKYITDISVLSDYNFHSGRMYFIGGNDMDKSITTFIADNHNLEVSDLSSEAIKNEIASLYERDSYKAEYIGIDENNKFVKRDISANEVRVAIQNLYDKIFELIQDRLSVLPKEILAEIHRNGIMFVGGANRIQGLYEYAIKKLDFPIIIQDDPQDSVILGAGKLLSQKEYLKITL